MEEIAEIFYKSYMKHNFKEHDKGHPEFDDALDKLIKSLSDEQKTLFFQYDLEQCEYIMLREIRLIQYIFELFLPEC